MIYFVEDDANIRKLVCYALEKEGYTVKGCSLPSEFWQEMKNEKPQLILLDIMLPKMNGFEVCQQIREFSDVPIGKYLFPCQSSILICRFSILAIMNRLL